MKKRIIIGVILIAIIGIGVAFVKNSQKDSSVPANMSVGFGGQLFEKMQQAQTEKLSEINPFEKLSDVSLKQTASTTKILSLMKDGGAPGKCKNGDECKTYCNDKKNISECTDFSEKVGFVNKENAMVIKKISGKGPGGCNSTVSCTVYCNIIENQNECLTFAREANLFAEEKIKEMEEVLKQTPPEMQNCIKSVMNKAVEKMKTGESIDTQTISQICLPAGTKTRDGKITVEMLKKMQEYYGTSLSEKDRDALQKVIEQNGGMIPQGKPLPSDQKTLTAEEIKKLNEDMQKELNKIPPEELEKIRKANEDAVNNPQEYQGETSGNGMGL
jgi:hypothetical protein